MLSSNLRIHSFLLFFLCSAAPLAGVAVVGHTAGQFQVGETGNASYAIPITAPPGTSGLAPQLAFAYNSQGSNSLLGVGWSLSGLSVIGRCPATIAQDGSSAPVDFDGNDRFCLDGERLMAIGGVYGANATEYRTEQDTFRQVISHGQAGIGPASFTVRTKAGLIFEYGGTADSRIEAQGKPSVLFWAVNRIADTKGNYLTVSYVEDNAEYRPSRVDYTANASAGLIPYASIRFTYETRPDATPQYVAGSMLKITQRLSAVRAYEGEQLYREYRIAYGISEASMRSRLVSITECGSNGDCFAPTTFAWRAWASGDFNFNGSGSGIWPGHGGGASNNFLGDFNGDGKTDIMGYTGSQGIWHVTLSSGANFNAPGGGSWNGHGGGASNNFVGDFNGDGRSDSMGYTGIQGKWHVALSSGTSFNAPGSGIWDGHGGGASNNFLGDFNGDGKTDIMGYTGSQGIWHVTLSSGTSFNAPGSGSWSGHGGGSSNNFVGDFNGDGRSDSMGYTGIQGKWHVALSSGTSFNAPGSGIWNGHGGGVNNNFLGDFNGDGKTDIIGYTGSQGLWHVALSSGTDFNAPGSGLWSGHSGGAGNNILGDFNGDGMTDIARYMSGNKWTVCLSIGTNFTCRDWVGHSGGPSRNFLGDFDGDGKTDLLGSTSTSGLWQVALSGGPSPDLLTLITDGHGLSTTINYSSIAAPSVYTKGSGAVYPEQDFQGPIYVVASYATSNGLGGVSNFSQSYAGAKVNLIGRGFRGFDQTIVTDVLTGVKTTIFYDRDYDCISTKIERVEQRQPDGRLISEVDNTMEIQDHGFGVHFSFVKASTTKSYELNGSLVSTVVTTTSFDRYGNVLTLNVDYGDGLTEKTVHTYQNDLNNWFLGRLTRSVVTKAALGQPTQVRTSAFTYDSVSGLLTSEIIEPDNLTLRLAKTYQHDVFGNITVSTTSGSGIASRSHTTTTDARGRYVIRSTNPLGHVETKSYELGNMTSLTGPNLLATKWEYDGFGRPIRELRADGTETRTVYNGCSGNCPEGAIYLTRSTTTGAATTATYYDLLDRVVRQEVQGFDGKLIYVDTKYNARGLHKWVSEPYFAGDATLWTEYNYDVLGRVTQETKPGNLVTLTEYAGRTTVMTNPLSQRNIRAVDARGQLIVSTDPLAGTVSYSYDAFGNMVAMVDPLGHRTILTYDVRGNRTSITDPDTGRSTFVYNALGELTSQTDANKNRTTLVYDVLGRLVNRTEPDGICTWVYDTRNKGIGKLSQVGRADYLEEYFYDTLGRAEKTRTTIAGVAFTLTTGYDLYSRPSLLTYPTGFSVRTLYNAQGYPQTLQRTSDNLPLWQAGIVNARGQLEQATFGNGLVTTRDFDPETGRLEQIRTGSVQNLAFTYDALGNLQSRRDDLRGLYEAFNYDSLNRLISSQVAGRAAVNIAYDALGNIVTKSDVGTYAYGQSGAGPHAVTSIVGVKGGAYLYDRNGNMVLRNSKTTISYTSFNKPKLITEGTTFLAFSYGPQYDRYRQVVMTPKGVTTKLYIGGIFEREITGSKIRSIHYIQAGGEVFAVYTAETTGTATLQSTRYLHKDHLGSVQTITNEVGAIVEVLAFDPWGLRRNAQDWKPADAAIVSSIDRGFTGHEQLDEVGLIHMNGRVYDPVIGRFLSADPFMQAPEYSQSLNRYSYVLNNPLSMTDPSGYFFRGLFRAIARVVRSAVNFIQSHAYTIINAVGFITGQPIISAILISIHSGIHSGAGFGEILRNTITAAAITAATIEFTQYIGGDKFLQGSDSLTRGAARVIAHGVVQGTSRAATGGKFEHGFLSGALGDVGLAAGDALGGNLGSPNLGAAIGGILAAGTADEIGGGKFTNGALTGALMYAVGRFSQVLASGRPLTAQEVARARAVYGDAIDYAAVRVYGGGFFLVQFTVMTPDGNIYWPGECGNLVECGDVTFIHEMMHILQHQSGVNVLAEGVLLHGMKALTLTLYNPYDYGNGQRPFGSYNIEQQAKIVEDRYRAWFHR
jgi:RHS repeat-associated protein